MDNTVNKIDMNRREFLAASTAAAMLGRVALTQEAEPEKPARIAFIGVGSRGTHLLKVLLNLPGTTVPAICDIDESHLNRSIEIVKKVRGSAPAGFSKGPYDYRRMLERDDFDGVLIATPADLHAEMSVDAMLAGKHVGSEVPGARTIEECWSLVKTKQKTGKRYMLLENYIYGQQMLMAYNMARQGLFGDLHYAECAYIHDCRSLLFNSDGSLTWRGEVRTRLFGNTYPTHSIGPVSKMLGIHRGDRMMSLVSMMNSTRSPHHYAVKRFGPESEAAKVKFVYGDYTSVLIKTAQGCLIRCDFDAQSPRPVSHFYLVQGAKGVFDSRGGKIYVDGKSRKHRWEGVKKYQEQYEHEYWRTRAAEARKSGHGGGDYFVTSDFVEMVRHDREPFVDVYDSAAWSAISPLSRDSISQGSQSVEMPDFTDGRWKEAEWKDAPWL